MKIDLIRFKSVKSTNDTAIRLIKKKISKPTIIIANKQTKGKGTRGKKWISLKENLFISIFFPITQNKLNFRQFSSINPFLIKKVISKYVSKNVKIKKPNDILYKNDKICGILQEVIFIKNVEFLIIGIGLNTNTLPKNKDFHSTSLKNIIKKKVDNNIILLEIKRCYESFLEDTKKNTYLEIKRKYKI